MTGALLVTALFALLPTVRAWWRAFLGHPQPSLLIVLALCGPLIGTGEGVDLARLQSGLPDAYRMIRALIYAGLFIVSMLAIINTPSRLKMAGPGLRWVLVYALFATGSAIYSDGPFISLWKGFEVLTLVLVMINVSYYLKTVDDTRWLLDVTALIALYLVITVFIGIALYPGMAFMNIDPLTGRGFFGARGLAPNMNPASEGAISGILAILVLAPLLAGKDSNPRGTDKLGLLIVLALAITLLLLCRARTQLFAFVFALVGLLFFSRRYLFGLFASIVGVVVIATSDAVLEYVYRGQSSEEFASLTGRLYWWDDVLEQLSSSAFLGRGFYAAQKLIYGVGVLDNTYLEVFFGLGIVGVILLLIPLLIATFSLWRTRPRSGIKSRRDIVWMQAGAMFTILLARSFTTSTFASMHAMMVYYLIVQASIGALLRFRREAKASVSMPAPGHATSRKKNPAVVSQSRRPGTPTFKPPR